MDSDEEVEEYSQWKGVPASIVLINAYEMTKSSAGIALEATIQMIKKYLRLSNSNHVSVCIYGLQDKNQPCESSTLVLFPLTMPTLDDFKKLCSIDIKTLSQSKELIMSEVLIQCSKMFSSCKKQLLSRTIFILSKLDVSPFEANQKPTLNIVRDLVDSNIEIKLVNISNNEYELHPFYKNLLIVANKGKDVELPEPIFDSCKIAEIIEQQSHRHLAVAQLNFEVGSNLAIGVGVFSLIKKSGYQKKFDLHKENNSVVTNVTKVSKMPIDCPENAMEVDNDGSEPKQLPLLTSEILFSQEFGGERIEFTHEEKKNLQNPFGPPKLKLLGFKPSIIMCKEKYFLKTGYFIFPNESIIEGSTVAFKALHKACLDMNVVAICVLCTRANSRPHLVALLPSTNPLGLKIDLGFDVIQIPYMENLRDIPTMEPEDIDIPESHILLFKNIINTTNFEYRPDMFVNPKLESEYKALEAIALDEENIEEFVDTTKQKPVFFSNLDDDLFEQLFGPFAAITTKRPAKADDNSINKKIKLTEHDKDLLKERIENHGISKYKVSELKEILKCQNNPQIPALTSLKKAELENLVYTFCK